MTDVFHKYTLTSGTTVVLREPVMDDVERAIMLVPPATSMRLGLIRQAQELIRQCLVRLNGKPVDYKSLQGDGLKKAFPGSAGLKDITQLGLIVDRLTNTTAEEDAAVFRRAKTILDPDESETETESADSGAETADDISMRHGGERSGR